MALINFLGRENYKDLIEKYEKEGSKVSKYLKYNKIAIHGHKYVKFEFVELCKLRDTLKEKRKKEIEYNKEMKKSQEKNKFEVNL